VHACPAEGFPSLPFRTQTLRKRLGAKHLSKVRPHLPRCLGELLEVFVVPSEDEIARLARRLANQFYTVLPSEPPLVIGTQLKAVHFARRAEANSDQDVVVAVRPTLRDFQMGRFRERPDVFSALRQAFEGWWDKLKVEESRAVPVFWIDGRSGEGKSVLLLQLVQHVLSGTAPPVIVRLSPDELPAWVARQRQRQHRLNHEGWQPIIAVIDDLHAVGDMEEWTQQLRSATDLAFPGIAVIACGPTPERQELERVCRPLLDVKHFTVPNLDAAEMDAFRRWYVDRTGKDVSLDASDPANRLLVIWMFELTQGRSLHDFAQNFRQRLVHHDLLDLAKVILAANAVELPAPSRLIAELHHEKRDRFGTLCRAGQLHFEETTQTVTTLKMDHSTFIGYRLAHLQIAWRLYCEWPRGYASLAATWARDLAEGVAAAMRQGDTDWAHALLARLGVTERLAEAATLERDPTSVGTKDELLADLYTELNCVLPEPDRIGLLPRWLNYLLRRPNLGLQPDPVNWAVELARQSSPPAELHASVAHTRSATNSCVLWLLARTTIPLYNTKCRRGGRTIQAIRMPTNSL
jgi:hypothetical protein